MEEESEDVIVIAIAPSLNMVALFAMVMILKRKAAISKSAQVSLFHHHHICFELFPAAPGSLSMQFFASRPCDLVP